MGDRRAGAEADRHPVLDQLGGGLGGEALLVVGCTPTLALTPAAKLYARRRDGRADLADGGGRRATLGAAARGAHRVGRDPEADIRIEDEAVSWNHLEIESRGGVLMATDLDSRNGTALNGEPLDRPRRLRDGDTLIVGGHRLEVSDPVPGRAGATVAAAEPVGGAQRGGAGDRRPRWSPPTAARAPSPAGPRPGRRSPRRSTSASAPPSAASTPWRRSSTSPARRAASGRA